MMPTKTKSKKAKTGLPTVHVTLAHFDTQEPFRVVRDGVAISEFSPLAPGDYRPRGGTPLLDASAKFIAKLGEQKAPGAITIGVLLDASGSMGGQEKAVIDGVNEFVGGMADTKADPDADGKVLAVIVTDGLENASHEVDHETLSATIQSREAEGWTFIYLGANQDAWAMGGSMGLSGTASGQFVNYVATPTGTKSAFREATNRGVNYIGEHDSYMANAGATSSSSLTEDGVLSTENTGAGQPAPVASGQHAAYATPRTPGYDVGAALRVAKDETEEKAE